MSKIKLYENKKLVLKQVVIFKLRDILAENIDTQISIFLKKIDQLGLITKGPLIVKSIDNYVDSNNLIRQSSDVIIQIEKKSEKICDLYEFQDEFISESCVMVHFEGSPSDIYYAYDKLKLHFFENIILSNGLYYTVFLEENENYVKVDIFKPVVNL